MGRFGIGYQVLVAVLLGIFSGIFFGPLTDSLKPIGDAYTMLLEMAVLPYICFSLIHGLGSITPTFGKKLFQSGWLFLLTLWVLTFVLIFLLSSSIPTTLSPLIETHESKDFESNFTKNFLTYLIPQNPFYDITYNIVPAIAIFGLIGGVALMHVEKKEPLIGALERINQTIEKVLKWLGILAPIGAFVYVAIAFGTLYLEDLYKIQIYIATFILTSLFLTFFILPLLLTSFTPMSYREAIRAFRYVCLLPFVTGLGPAALPFLNQYLKQLSQRHETHERFRETSQTVLPIAYSFGNIGNAMVLFFILFLAYYYRHPLSTTETTLLSVLTFPISIGSSSSNINSIQFLIQQLGFPDAAFDFFLKIKAFTYNFQVMMSTAGVLTLIILTLYSHYGLLVFKWRRLFVGLGGSFALFAVCVFSFRSLAHFEDVYQNLYMQLKLEDVIPYPVQAERLSGSQEGAPRTFQDNFLPESFQQILSTKVLKVGFYVDSVPFCYFNDQKELVGFDIAYAYALAHDLDCKLQFVPIEINQLAQDLDTGRFDIGMSSIIMSENRLLQMDFSLPYYEDDTVLIVPRSQKNQFLHLDQVRNKKDLKIAAGGAQFDVAKRNFPLATVVNTESIKLLTGDVNAILWTQITGVVWCLLHPEYVTISYGAQLGKNYFGYPIRQHATDFGFFLNNWLFLKEQSGFKKKMHSYWIDGVLPDARPPRWSILRNLFHVSY